MSKQIILSPQQRENGIKNLIANGEEMGFNKGLIQSYEVQLLDIQKVIQIDKDKIKQFKIKIIERGLS